MWPPRKRKKILTKLQKCSPIDKRNYRAALYLAKVNPKRYWVVRASDDFFLREYVGPFFFSYYKTISMGRVAR